MSAVFTVYKQNNTRVASGLFSAELDLVIASLTLAGTIHYVSEGDLLSIYAPCVRKDGIWRNIVLKKTRQAELALAFQLQKTHIDARIFGVVKG